MTHFRDIALQNARLTAYDQDNMEARQSSGKVMPMIMMMMIMIMMIASLVMASGATYTHNISVSASNGTNNTTICWYNPLYPCSQLSDALDAINHFKTDVCVTVLDDVSLLTPVTMTSVSDIILRGVVHQVTVNCSNQGGLSFIGSDNIQILNLIFENCSMEHNSTSFRPINETRLQFYCAVYFSGCNDITISGVDVRYSNGTGMTLYDVNGYVDINYSSFYGNQPHNGNGGGGLYIEFTYSNPDDDSQPNNTPANYYIYNCSFTDNVADVKNENDTLFIRPLNNSHLSFSRGGGISIYFKGNATYKNISMSKCFIVGNTAYWGAGIFAEFQDTSSHNNFIVDFTIIHNNTTPQLDKNSGTGGGGVRTGYVYYEPKTINHNNILFTNCQISSNKAYWGGGISYRNCPEQGAVEASNKLFLINCTLEYNVARLGSAIDVTVWHGLPTGAFSSVVIINCRFLYNSVSYANDDNTLLGKGALYIDTIPVNFSGSANLFEGNSGSALAVVSTGVEYLANTSITFCNNTGGKGGAIALLGGSWMTINENTNLSFYNNKAIDKGGAIYVMSVGEHDLISSRNCFIRYCNSSVPLSDWSANFTFVDNEAQVAGDSIYATTLLPCIWTTSNASSYNLSEATKTLFTNSPFHYNCSSNKSGSHSEIATAASHFALSSTTVYSGQLKKLPINITDDKGNDASSYTSFVVVTNNSSTYDVENNYISNQMIRLFGEPNSSSFDLTLLTTSTTPYSIVVPVSIHHCPPGLCRTSNKTCGCKCNHRSYQGVESCDPDLYQSKISSLFWAGYIGENHKGDDRYFVTAYCPNGFCGVTKNVFSNFSELDEAICQSQNRTGILCGRCMTNTSVYSSSMVANCGQCTNLHQHRKYYGILQFTLYEIVPLILFFLFLVIFNINLTSGPLNGFIFFSQVISSLAGYNHQFTIHKKNILLFYSIWNLNFLETVLPPYCLMEGWTTLDVFAFHYISAAIPLVLILIVIFMMNYRRMICFPLTCLFQRCHCCLQCLPPCRCGFMDSKPIKFLVALKNNIFSPHSKVLHGLAATLVLSYSKFLSISFLLIVPSLSLYTNWPPNDSGDNRLRVLLDGNSVYFGAGHIQYAIPATIIVILSTVPPLVLLFRPAIHRCHNLERLLRRCLPLTRIDHFLDEFYSCYRPKCQWYASMYFFYRIALFSTYSFTLSTQQYIIQQLLCIVFLVVHGIVQPYTSRLYNCIDLIILGVLLALSCLHEQLFLVSHDIIEDHWPSEFIGVALVCVPLLYLVIYLLSIIVKHCYASYKEVSLNAANDAYEEFDNMEEEYDQMHEEHGFMDNRLQVQDTSQINHQDNDDNSLPLQPMVDDIASSDSTSDSPSPEGIFKYGTFSANRVPHTT